jgi:hypothetical protein
MEKLDMFHAPLASVCLAGTLIGAAGCAARQDLLAIAEQPDDSLDLEVAQLTDELHLSVTQRKQVKGVVLRRYQSVQALFNQYPTPSAEALTANLRRIRKQTSHAIDLVLTPQQRALVRAMVARTVTQ